MPILDTPQKKKKNLSWWADNPIDIIQDYLGLVSTHLRLT